MNISLNDLSIGVRKKHYRKIVAKRSPRGASIEKRLGEIKARTTCGHWEMDCICGSTCPALLVLSERLTRKEIIMPIPN